MSRVLVAQAVALNVVPDPCGAYETKTMHSRLALDTVALVINAVLDMAVLPAECVPVGVEVATDDLDSNGTPLITLDCGLITGRPGDDVFANRVCGNEAFAASTVGQAGGVARHAKAAFLRVPAQPVDRSVGLKVAAAPATAVVAASLGTNPRGLWLPGTAYATGDFVVLPGGVHMACTTAGISGVYGANDRERATQKQPAWNIGFGQTTTDGTVTWTCRTPVIDMLLSYRAARNGA